MNREEMYNYHTTELDNYKNQITEYITRYGNDKSDYLLHRIYQICFHRGAIGVLDKLKGD